MVLNRGGTNHVRVNLRFTNPHLYRSMRNLAVASVLMALNFWFAKPTFHPYGIHKSVVGGVFALLGLWVLVFLKRHDLRQVRNGLAVAVGVLVLWGLANAEQSVAGAASFQLVITYLWIAAEYHGRQTEPPVVAVPVIPAPEREE